MPAAALNRPSVASRTASALIRAEGAGPRPIDLVHLARATDGDQSLEAELLAMFERQSAKLVERVALADLPRRARGDIAHRLRGSALAIGAFAVAETAGALEAALEGEGDTGSELGALQRAVAEARAAIAELAP